MIPPRHILIIRFSSLGDIILLTPLFRELHRLYPEAKIDFLTSTTFSELCANNPHISNIIAIDREAGTAALNGFIKNHPASEYDLVLDAHRSLRSRLLMIKWLGLFHPFSRKTAFINKRSFRRVLLLKTGINRMQNAVSQREAYLQLIPPEAAPRSVATHTELFPSPENRLAVARILAENDLQHRKLVAIGPGASCPGKCWPQERFLELSEMLQAAGYSIIILGSAEEAEPVWICENSTISPLNLAGKLKYLETAALLENCSLVISNDTAVVHFAEAMQIPAIAIFGPTTLEFGYAPFLEGSRVMEINLSCRPCSRNGKGGCNNVIQRQCLVDISVASVLQASLQILGR